MATETYFDRISDRVRTDGRYPFDAYAFLHAGLEFTARQLFGDEPEEGASRHISGRQLCCGLRDLAVQNWGPLAGLVLRRWGIHTTRDFGNMVYVLVEAELLGKQDDDRIEDFDGVYDFAEAFETYRTPLEAFDGAAPVDA